MPGEHHYITFLTPAPNTHAQVISHSCLSYNDPLLVNIKSRGPTQHTAVQSGRGLPVSVIVDFAPHFHSVAR